MSRIQSILRKNSDSPSTSTLRATEMQMFANSGSDYGNKRLDDENFNIMQFWHQVKGIFQILASMACDILAVPVSTVTFKSCFSGANRVLTDKRIRLGERVFETLVLLKDWYDAENILQDKSWMYQINREETDASSSNVTSEGMSEVEVNQSHEEQDQLAKYSNPYMYNYEEYGYMYNTMHGDFFKD
jgi:hAT family C-terminal dimerisation region